MTQRVLFFIFLSPGIILFFAEPVTSLDLLCLSASVCLSVCLSLSLSLSPPLSLSLSLSLWSQILEVTRVSSV